jgi:hypothetical protein
MNEPIQRNSQAGANYLSINQSSILKQKGQMLDAHELEQISAFARFVDYISQARATAASTSTLDEVAAIAHSLRYQGISKNYLSKRQRPSAAATGYGEKYGAR